jgi:hypothetical protein
MADIIELEIVAKATGLKPMVSTVERLERQLIRATKALDQNKISQGRYNKILTSAKQQYMGLGNSIQKANTQVDNFVNSTKLAAAAQTKEIALNKQYAVARREATAANARHTAETTRSNAVAAKAIATEERLKNKFIQGYAAADIYAKELRDLNMAHTAGIISSGQHSSALNRLNTQMSKGTGAFSSYGSGVAGATQKQSKMGVVAQQSGYQVGDFLVQIQSGANPMMAFGQQATQLVGVMSLFGPKMLFAGAALGIIIPLVTAIAGSMLRSSGAVKEFSEAMDDATSALDEYISLASKVDDTISESFDLATESIHATSEAYQDLIMLAKLDAFNNIISLNDSLIASARSSRMMRNELEEVMLLLSATPEQGTSGWFAGAVKEAEEFNDLLDKLDNADGLQNRYIAATALKEAFIAMVGPIEDQTDAQQEFSRALSNSLYTMELMGAATGEETEAQKALRETEEDRIRGLEFMNKLNEIGLGLTYDQYEAEGERNSAQEDSLATAQEMLATMNAENMLQAVINRYGEESVQVARERTKQEEDTFMAMLDTMGITQGINAETDELRGQLVRAFEATRSLKKEADQISFEAAAREASQMAANLRAAGQAIADIRSATANMDLSTVGIEAQNRALEEGNSLIQARAEGLIAVKREELSGALGFGDSVIRIAAQRELDAYTESVNRSSEASERNTALTDALRESTKDAGGAADSAADDFDKLREALEAEALALNQAANPLLAYITSMARLGELQAANAITSGAYLKAVDDLNKGLIESYPAIDGVADAFQDFMGRGFKDFSTFVDDILDLFKNMLIEMAMTALRNEILIPMVMGKPSGGGVGQAASGGGTMSNLMGSLGTGTGVAGLAGGTGFLGGVGNVVGGLASGGLTGALGGVTASMGSFAMAAGAIAAPLLAVAAVFTLLKKKTKELDSGLRITADFAGTLAETFKTIETSGLLRKTRVNTEYNPMEDSSPITDAVDAIKDQTMALGSVLGLTADNFSSFSAKIKVSLKGLSEQEANAAIVAAFGEISNQLSYAALGHFQETYGGIIREGETAVSTLENMVSALNLVNPTFELLGFALFDASVQGAALARNMADTFGGFENFSASTSTYYDKFFSDAEKVADATRLISREFDSMNVAMPKTLAEFRELVEVAASLGNMSLAANLIELSGSFAALKEAEEALAETTSDLTAEQVALNAALEDQAEAQIALGLAVDGVSDAQSTLNAAFAEYEQAVGREITRLNSVAETALEPLLKGITDAEAAADEARTALDNAMSALSSFVGAQIEAAKAAAEAVIEPLQRELDALKLAADGASTALDSAMSSLVSFVSAQIDIINSDLATAITGIEGVAKASADLSNEMQSVFEATFKGIMKALDEQEAQVTESYASQINTVSEAMESASDSAGLLADKLKLIEDALTSRQLTGITADLNSYRGSQESLRGFANGNEFDADELKKALEGLSQDTTRFFSTREDYTRDFMRTNSDLRSLQGGVSGELSVDQQQLASMQSQVTVLEEQRDIELSSIQASREEAQAIYDATLAVLDTQRTGNLTLEGLQSSANDYVVAAQASVVAQEAATADITLLREDAATQIKALEDQLAKAQETYDQATGQSESLTSIDEGMAKFNQAMVDYNAAQTALGARQDTILAEIAGAEAARELQVAVLNDQLEKAQDIYDEATGQSKSLESLDEGMAKFNQALEDLAAAQMTAQEIKDANQPLIDSINETLAADTQLLKTQLETFREQVAPIASLPEAIDNLNSAIAGLANANAALATATANSSSADAAVETAIANTTVGQIEQIYQDTLNRDSDQAGMDFYSNLVDNGFSIGGVRDDIANSPEAALLQSAANDIANSPAVTQQSAANDNVMSTAQQVQQLYQEAYGRNTGSVDMFVDKIDSGTFSIENLRKVLMPNTQSFAGGGYTGDGPRSGGLDGQGGFMAMLHPQEDVIDRTRSAPKASNDMGSSDNVHELRREISELRSEQRQILMDISKNTKRTADIERKHDVQGTPPVRAA